jgi:hypothetical protein
MGYLSFGYFDLSRIAVASGTAPDLMAAVVARLRASPSVVAAFAENTASAATTKFWADAARQGVVLPWAVYEEIEGDIQYMTQAAGTSNTIETGAIRFVIVSAGKKAARDLGRLVSGTLDDAPLVFDDGILMYLRAKKPFFVPVADIAPENPTAYARVVVFEFMISRAA